MTFLVRQVLRTLFSVLVVLFSLRAEASELHLDAILSELNNPNSTITSVEDFLEWASKKDPTFFEHFTLARESQSLQESSPLYPRAIVFGKTARLFLTFNGNPEHKGFHKVELIQYQRPDPHSVQGTHFEFREILFSKTESPKISQKNPPKCMQCHTTSLKPIWDQYEIWEGLYGKFDDAIVDYENLRHFRGAPSPATASAQAQELKDFRSFQKHQKTHSRYRFLKPPRGSPVSPYSPESRGDYKFRPNLDITHKITSHHSTVIAGRLQENVSCYDEYEEWLLYELLGCRNDQTWQESKLAQVEADLKSLRGDHPIDHEAWAPYAMYRVERPMVGLLSVFGIEKEEWNLSLKPRFWRYFEGRFNLQDRLVEDLYYSYRQRHSDLPVLREIYSGRNGYQLTRYKEKTPKRTPDVQAGIPYDNYYDENGYIRPDPEKSQKQIACEFLIEQDKKTSKGPDQCMPFTEKPEHMPASVQLCQSCHNGESKRAPVIPFGNHAQLAAEGWIDAIKKRVLSTDARDQMPPKRKLHYGERTELFDYLRLSE